MNNNNHHFDQSRIKEIMKVVNDIQPDETDLSLDLKESLKVIREK